MKATRTRSRSWARLRNLTKDQLRGLECDVAELEFASQLPGLWFGKQKKAKRDGELTYEAGDPPWATWSFWIWAEEGNFKSRPFEGELLKSV